MQCVSVLNMCLCGVSHRCGTTFVPTEEKAAITPSSKRMEDVLFGTTRKRWELTQYISMTLARFELILYLSEMFFYFSSCQKSRNIWNAPLLSVNLISKSLWMNLMAKWLMGSAGLQGVRVSFRVLFVCCHLLYLLLISVSISSHTPQVVSIRAMWIYWPQPCRNWPTWRERPRHPSFISAIYPTSSLRPSKAH